MCVQSAPTALRDRALVKVAGQHACDPVIGGGLQIDARGNSSTATNGRVTGFGGGPNMGADIACSRKRMSVRWSSRIE